MLIYSVVYSIAMLPLRKLAQIVVPHTFILEMLSLDFGQNSDCSFNSYSQPLQPNSDKEP